MKKVSIILLMLTLIFSLSACSPSQAIAKRVGGTTVINLPPNEKFLEITWKDEDLWYLTRSMRDDEVAETYEFNKRSVSGLFEGTVIINESMTNEFDKPEGLRINAK